jgi:hypothetical protein
MWRMTWQALSARPWSPEVHERETNRFLFRLHLFGTGREFTLRSESTGTLVTTFLLGRAVQVDPRLTPG